MNKQSHRYTEQEAFQKLSALCAVAEYCKADMRRKMEHWLLTDAEAEKDAAAKERVISRLVKEQYIDERRYAHAFVRDKFRYNRWGKLRIQQELRMKGIAQEVIGEALQELPAEETEETLRRLIEQKRPSVKGQNAYEINMKLMRFALSRGFEADMARKVIGEWEDF